MFQTEFLGFGDLKLWKRRRNGNEMAERRYSISNGEKPTGLFSHLMPQKETERRIIAPAATANDMKASDILI
jgi:hypothetical protein